MNSCGFKQIPMDSNGFSWIQTNLHGFKRISDVDSNSYTQTPAFHLKLFVKNKENNTEGLSVGMAQRQHAPTCGYMCEYVDTCACQNPHAHVSTYKMGQTNREILFSKAAKKFHKCPYTRARPSLYWRLGNTGCHPYLSDKPSLGSCMNQLCPCRWFFKSLHTYGEKLHKINFKPENV